MDKIITVHKCRGKKWRKYPSIICSFCADSPEHPELGGSFDLTIPEAEYESLRNQSPDDKTSDT